jgi:hypothetical protein
LTRLTMRQLDNPDRMFPEINCPDGSMIQYLDLSYNDLDDTSNLESLKYLQSLEELVLTGNEFTTFPNLPYATKQTLVKLDVFACDIRAISAQDVEGFGVLSKVDVGSNPLVTVTPTILLLSEELWMELPVVPWDVQTWLQTLCDAPVEKLRLYGGGRSILHVPDLSPVLSYRPMTLHLSEVRGLSCLLCR